jgi:hypothetical protein
MVEMTINFAMFIISYTLTLTHTYTHSDTPHSDHIESTLNQLNSHRSVETQSSVELVHRGNAAKKRICCTDGLLLYHLRTIVRTS